MMRNIRKNKDLGIYGLAAKWYDRNSRKSRLTEMKEYANEVASHVMKGAHILEVAPGPGYLSIELAKRGFHVTAIDISPDFVEIATQNAKEANVSVNFIEGNATHLPFEDNRFDFVVCTAAFKNFKEPVKALCEMHRVLKKEGTALIIDMNREATDEEIEHEVSKMKGFDKYFVKFSFKTFLKQGAYTKEEFETFIKETPFKNYDIRKEGIGLYVYLYK
ncbi:methyltransferase type 11 [Anoxybacillus gonensis]|uniref:Class I SAM-dependent methyltransferase n=1 Tax=Anoxybacillus gonensis TaxID=198467 RepID=A0AAW7TJD4_9BACL|nr:MULTISPECIES: class I SAM-dependent methyltransferase [Anoxybacillus]THD15394.1 class I SAM-dependent methyltransferase [Anoxybacillus ayderensis]AKS37280.1 methyltransferase type 11 [Anoxybacillus gonensis]KGP61962.1 methyltransferase type 11 [Anoxybacillus gonensis]MBW9219147.1 class I SAM-dependent methyltransferase [Anoxybacillus sp. ST70]MDO0878169.1 class I SAM-dependent methyltransferase [Anoxybacillus gonensis]